MQLKMHEHAMAMGSCIHVNIGSIDGLCGLDPSFHPLRLPEKTPERMEITQPGMRKDYRGAATLGTPPSDK